MTTALVPSEAGVASFEELERVAGVMASSRLFKGITSKESAMALMMLCQSEGLHYMQAMRRYHIIEGTPSLRSEVMLADFMARGGTVKWIKRTDAEVTAFFASKGCPDGATITWDDARIARAGLTQKANHKAYPLAMKQARVISEGVKATDPAVIAGFYAPEEVMDFNAAPDWGNPTPSKPYDKPIAPLPTEYMDKSTPEQLAAIAAKPSNRAGKRVAAEAAKAETPKAPGPEAEKSSTPTDILSPTIMPTVTESASPSESHVAPSPTAMESTTATSADGCETEEESADHDEPTDDVEYVDCYKQAGGFAILPLEVAGPEPKRSLEQNAKLHALFAQLNIDKDDTPPGPENKGKGIEGARTRIYKKFGKESTAQLSVRECSILIDVMENRIRLHGTPADRERRYREDGMIKQPDGTWRLPT